VPKAGGTFSSLTDGQAQFRLGMAVGSIRIAHACDGLSAAPLLEVGGVVWSSLYNRPYRRQVGPTTRFGGAQLVVNQGEVEYERSGGATQAAAWRGRRPGPGVTQFWGARAAVMIGQLS